MSNEGNVTSKLRKEWDFWTAILRGDLIIKKNRRQEPKGGRQNEEGKIEG
jgi:hypothetical protein